MTKCKCCMGFSGYPGVLACSGIGAAWLESSTQYLTANILNRWAS